MSRPEEERGRSFSSPRTSQRFLNVEESGGKSSTSRVSRGISLCCPLCQQSFPTIQKLEVHASRCEQEEEDHVPLKEEKEDHISLKEDHVSLKSCFVRLKNIGCDENQIRELRKENPGKKAEPEIVVVI